MGELYENISSIVGDERVWDDETTLNCYSRDRGLILPSTERTPDLVVSPRTTEEVVEIVKLANERKIPIIPVGYLNNFWGACTPLRGGIVIDCRGMNEVIEIDEENRIAVVQPGVTIKQLCDSVEKFGLFYADRPSSWKINTIGGRLAINGGSIFAVKYGRPVDQVVSLKLVTGSGKVVRLGPVRTYDPGTGYDLTRLCLASEGTVGVFTEITVKLQPIPEKLSIMAVEFPTVDHMMKALIRMVDSCGPMEISSAHDGIGFLDYIRVAYQEFYKVPMPEIHKDSGVALVGWGGESKIVDIQESVAKEIIRKYEGKLLPDEDARRWFDLRMMVHNPWPKKGGKKRNFHPTAVFPISEVTNVLRIQRDLCEKYGFENWGIQYWFDQNIRHQVTAHLGIYVDWWSEEDVKKAFTYRDDIFREIIKMGGAIGSVGGIGFSTHLLYDQLESEALELLAQIKKLFDPNLVLNPGKKLPMEVVANE